MGKGFSAVKMFAASKNRAQSFSFVALVLFACLGRVTEMAGDRLAHENHPYVQSDVGTETSNSGINAVWAINDSEKIDKDDLQNPHKASNSVWDGRSIK